MSKEKAVVTALGKPEMIDIITEKTEISKADVTAVVDSVFALITNTVAEGERPVNIVGFGKYENRRREARPGRNPKTGEAMTYAAKNYPAFTAGSGFKRAVEEAGQAQEEVKAKETAPKTKDKKGGKGKKGKR